MAGRFTFPERVDHMRLPGVTKLSDGTYVSQTLGLNIDDTTALRAGLIQSAIEQYNPDLLIVDNGLAAVEMLAKEQVDLILMDCQMPKLSGLAATAQLRALGVTTPIIALTAYARAEDESECLAAGMDDYLKKPFRQSDLLRVLTRWFGSGLPEQVAQGDSADSQKSL